MAPDMCEIHLMIQSNKLVNKYNSEWFSLFQNDAELCISDVYFH